MLSPSSLDDFDQGHVFLASRLAMAPRMQCFVSVIMMMRVLSCKDRQGKKHLHSGCARLQPAVQGRRGTITLFQGSLAEEDLQAKGTESTRPKSALEFDEPYLSAHTGQTHESQIIVGYSGKVQVIFNFFDHTPLPGPTASQLTRSKKGGRAAGRLCRTQHRQQS